MKICIVTLPLHTNYGGVLQAYALQTVLERMGHRVELLNKPLNRGASIFSLLYVTLKRVALRCCGRKDELPTDWWRKMREDAKICRHTNGFIRQYIHCRFVNRVEELSADDFDAMVVGSDQIWRRIYPFWGTIEHAFLDFTDGWRVKRVAYAASFGREDVSEYSEEEQLHCAAYLRSFDAVSVREESGVELCADWDVKASCVLDPTLLLDRVDYLSLIERASARAHEGELFHYFLDNDEALQRMVNAIAEHFQWRSFKVNGEVENDRAPIEERIQPPVEEWLDAFRSSRAVVTDSFHACVFSIIFDKPFLVCVNEMRGINRLESLLAKFGLEDRLVASSQWREKANLLCVAPGVGEQWNRLKVESLAFLTDVVGSV